MKKELISEWTRQELASSLFGLMRKKPLDKISVKEITDACGIPRSTFYYHFADIYDLTSWAMSIRVIECLTEEDDCLLWGKGLLTLFRHSQENYVVCRCAVSSAHIWEMADSYCERCMNGVMAGMHKIDGDRNTDPKFLYFLGRFYGHAVLAELVRWFRGDMTVPAEEITGMLDIFIRESIVATLDKVQENPTLIQSIVASSRM